MMNQLEVVELAVDKMEEYFLIKNKMHDDFINKEEFELDDMIKLSDMGMVNLERINQFIDYRDDITALYEIHDLCFNKLQDLARVLVKEGRNHD